MNCPAGVADLKRGASERCALGFQPLETVEDLADGGGAGEHQDLRGLVARGVLVVEAKTGIQ